MARRALERGEHGRVNSKKIADRHWESTTWRRDMAGKRRQIAGEGPTKDASIVSMEANITRALGKRGNGVLTPDTKFPDVGDAWVAWQTPRVGKPGEISQQTFEEYQRLLNNVLKPPLEHLRIREVDTALIDDVLQEEAVEHPSQARNTQTVIKHVMGHAVRQRLITHNPVRETLTIARSKKKARALTLNEVPRLRKLVREYRKGEHVMGPRQGPEFADIVDVMLGTGVRISEVLAIRWEDVKFSRYKSTVTICGTIVTTKKDGRFRQEWTKNKEERELVIPSFTAQTLLRRFNENVSGSPLVFPSRVGTVKVADWFHKVWRKCRAGTEFEWVVPHTLRKTVATLLDSELDAVAASKQLGHGSETITKKHYIQKATLMPDVSDRLEKLGPDDDDLDGPDATVTAIA